MVKDIENNLKTFVLHYDTFMNNNLRTIFFTFGFLKRILFPQNNWKFRHFSKHIVFKNSFWKLSYDVLYNKSLCKNLNCF